MLRYVFKRIMIFIPTFFVISVLIFGLSKAAPGDPVEILLEGGMGSASTGSSADFANKERAYAQKAEELGLDKPAFYLQLSSAAYPKDLYKIQKKTQHEMVERMIDRTGNAAAVMAYFKALKKLTATSIELKHGSYQQKLYVRQRVEELLVEYDTGGVNFRIDTLSTLIAADTVLFEQLGTDWAAVTGAYKRMCTEQQRYKLYIPTFYFNGLDNQYHVWMFGDYPWFSTVDSSAYHKRMALSDSIRSYRSEERGINRQIRSAKRLIGAQHEAAESVDSLALQQAETKLFALKAKINTAFEYRKKLTKEMPKYVSKGFLRGDFGISYADGKAVSLKLKSALFWTLIMNLIAIFISYLLSIPLGVQSALWKLRGNVKRDNLVTGLLFVLY
jgi:ABC-type dipeptide/oligopeptide/nickel transport system permease component